MNKRELVKATAAATSRTAIEVNEILSAALDITAQALIDGDKVTINNYGTFEVKENSRARKTYNFATQSMKPLEARRRVIFHTGKGLYQCLNEPIKED